MIRRAWDLLRRDERARSLAVIAILVIVFLASAARNIKEDGDFVHYIEAGARVLRGADIYEGAGPDAVNTWPPLFAVVCVPFALLAQVSVYLARGTWLLANAVLVAAMLRMVVELVHGRPLALRSVDGVAVASGAFLGPLVLSSRFLLGNFDRLQINLFILFGCLVGCRWLTRGREGRGGAAIGFAAAMKVLPIFFVPYLLCKRWWRALAGMLVGGAVASAAPILVFGPARWWAYVRFWLRLAAGGWPVRKGNQSVYAMIDRLYSHGALYWTPAAKRFKASDDPVVAAMVYGTLLIIAVLFAYAARRGGRRPRTPAAVTELATVLAISVLFSPLAWKHYFVFLLLGYTVLWRAAFVSDPPPPDGHTTGVAPHLREPRDPLLQPWGLSTGERRRVGVLVALSFALTTLSVRGVIGKRLSLHLETLSVVTVGALVALAALLYLRARLGVRET
ncbi:MAG TPA: glycosyltransferase family 87 protein [Candidatus Binatia bacterium]